MSYNLTSRQKALVRWFVERVRDGDLPEEFHIIQAMTGPVFADLKGERNDCPEIRAGILEALQAAEMLVVIPAKYGTRCVLTGKAYEAVESNFGAPDVSFVTHLTPLADVTNLDSEIKTRCLPILGAGSGDPKLWDSAVRTAGVILEERLRDVGGIADPGCVGSELVNAVFGSRGTLASRFLLDSERQGHRDLYAGMVGAFRNPYAHRLVDPTPEDGGAYIVFVNLLLEMLEDLRLK